MRKPDLDIVVTFYSTHSGFRHLPSDVKKIADEISGKTMPLKEAVEKIKMAVRGAKGMSVKFVEEYKYIALEYVVPDDNPSKYKFDHVVHFWKIISYR